MKDVFEYSEDAIVEGSQVLLEIQQIEMVLSGTF